MMNQKRNRSIEENTTDYCVEYESNNKYFSAKEDISIYKEDINERGGVEAYEVGKFIKIEESVMKKFKVDNFKVELKKEVYYIVGKNPSYYYICKK